MQIPLEIILGPLGAVAVLLWWNHELRKSNADLQKRLDAFVDEIRAALRAAR